MKSKSLNLLFILWPWILSSILLDHFFSRSVFAFTPYWSDELVYWLSSKTFQVAGWSGGYFGISEIQSPIAASHWGLHGPLFPMLYAVLNYFFGWHLYSAILTNHFLLSLGLGFFLWVSNLPLRTKGLLFVLYATFWSVNQFSTSNMQESWHHFLALFMAGLACRFVQQPGRRWDGFDILGFILLLYSSAMRPAWSILFLPMSWIIFQQRRSLLMASAFSILMIALSPIAFKLLAAPMPNGGAQFVKFMTGAESIGKTLDYFLNNLRLFLFEGDSTERNQRIQIFSIVVLALAWLFPILKRKEFDHLLTAKNRALIGISFLLLAYVGATMTMYLVGGQADYRVLSAPLLFSIFLIFTLDVPWKPYITAAILGLNLWAMKNYLGNFNSFRSFNYSFDQSEIKKFEEGTKSHLHYVPGANPWCNTVLSGGLEPWVYVDMAGLPAGFGVQGVWNWKYMQAPLKSKYVMLDARSVNGEKVSDYLAMMKVVDSKDGQVSLEIEKYGIVKLKELARVPVSGQPYVLYENLESFCDRKSL